MAEAGPAAAPADPRRRDGAEGARPRARATATCGCPNRVAEPRRAQAAHRRAARACRAPLPGHLLRRRPDGRVRLRARRRRRRPGACSSCPTPTPTRCCRWWSNMPSWPPDIAEEHFAAARVGRLATVTALGPPACRPGLLRPARGQRLHRGRREAEGHERAGAAGERPRHPSREPAGRPLRGGLVTPVVGAGRRRCRGRGVRAGDRRARRQVRAVPGRSPERPGDRDHA